jgi:hypothetical protein
MAVVLAHPGTNKLTLVLPEQQTAGVVEAAETKKAAVQEVLEL